MNAEIAQVSKNLHYSLFHFDSLSVFSAIVIIVLRLRLADGTPNIRKRAQQKQWQQQKGNPRALFPLLHTRLPFTCCLPTGTVRNVSYFPPSSGTSAKAHPPQPPEFPCVASCPCNLIENFNRRVGRYAYIFLRRIRSARNPR